MHTVYGWSIRLLGAFFGSITHLLVHLRANDNSNNNNDNDDSNNDPEPMELIVPVSDKQPTPEPAPHIYHVREVAAENQNS